MHTLGTIQTESALSRLFHGAARRCLWVVAQLYYQTDTWSSVEILCLKTETLLPAARMETVATYHTINARSLSRHGTCTTTAAPGHGRYREEAPKHMAHLLEMRECWCLLHGLIHSQLLQYLVAETSQRSTTSSLCAFQRSPAVAVGPAVDAQCSILWRS